MALLAIDPGTFTGWAVSYDGIRVDAFGTWKLRLTARWGRGGRLLELEQHLDRLGAQFDIGRVAFEEPFVGRFSSACMPLAAMAVFMAALQARSGRASRNLRSIALNALAWRPNQVPGQYEATIVSLIVGLASVAVGRV